eukprot:13659256-Ditylum_brightwellii.AAC.1
MLNVEVSGKTRDLDNRIYSKRLIQSTPGHQDVPQSSPLCGTRGIFSKYPAFPMPRVIPQY